MNTEFYKNKYINTSQFYKAKYLKYKNKYLKLKAYLLSILNKRCITPTYLINSLDKCIKCINKEKDYMTNNKIINDTNYLTELKAKKIKLEGIIKLQAENNNLDANNKEFTNKEFTNKEFNNKEFTNIYST